MFLWGACSVQRAGEELVVLKSPSEYVKELELDSDDEDDIAEELQQAVDAWRAVVGGGDAETVDLSDAAAVQDEDGGMLCQLMTRLGTTYSAESHGSELRRIAASNADKADHLCVADFADWFVRWLHAPDSSSDDESATDNAERDNATGSIGPKSGMWSATTWTVPPSSHADPAESWKCGMCSARNSNQLNKCAACEGPGPLSASSQSLSSSSSSSTASPFIFGVGEPSARKR